MRGTSSFEFERHYHMNFSELYFGITFKIGRMERGVDGAWS